MYTFDLTARFKRHFDRLSTNEKQQVKRKLTLLAENPMHPSLRTKYIKGHSDVFECSVNMDIRIIWRYKEFNMILLADVGHHDILKQF